MEKHTEAEPRESHNSLPSDCQAPLYVASPGNKTPHNSWINTVLESFMPWLAWDDRALPGVDYCWPVLAQHWRIKSSAMAPSIVFQGSKHSVPAMMGQGLARFISFHSPKNVKNVQAQATSLRLLSLYKYIIQKAI